MLGNECVMSPPVEKVKRNGHLTTASNSPLTGKNEVAAISPERRPGQPQISGSSPNSGGQVLEENGTPDVKSNCKSKYYACPPSGSLKHLHRTPPSRTKSIVVSNPFDVGIADRLPFPMYSPSVFARVVSPSQDSPTFRWTIEDISRIYPADIEEFPAHQFNEEVDPELESKAQEAINRFFCKNQPLLPSPWNGKPIDTAALRQEINAGTPTAVQVLPINATPVHSATNQNIDSDSDAERISSSLKCPSREVWTQTTLTLPPVLPPSMELALKPFFTFTQDQQQAQQAADGDDGVLSTSSLRRKLFFQSESSPSPTPGTPPHPHFSVAHGSTSHLVQFQGRTFGTPLPGNSAIQSSPGISPVHSGATPMRRVKSATRLDFTRDHEEMSIDSSLPNAPGTPRQTHHIAQAGACSPLGTAPLHDKEVPEEHDDHSQHGMKWAKRNKRISLNCSTDAMSISQTSTPVKVNLSMDVSSAQSMMDISQSKPSNQSEAWREGETLPDAAYQHEVTSFSYSHQAVSSNMMSQDTGYATRSSCDPATFQSGTNSMFGLSLTRDKMGYEDSLATWPINPNVVSSTPTKTLGARISEFQRDTA